MVLCRGRKGCIDARGKDPGGKGVTALLLVSTKRKALVPKKHFYPEVKGK